MIKVTEGQDLLGFGGGLHQEELEINRIKKAVEEKLDELLLFWAQRQINFLSPLARERFIEEFWRSTENHFRVILYE